MLAELPFKLKVVGSDRFEGLNAISTSFRFSGWLRLEEGRLRIEWRGQAAIQQVAPLSVRDDRLPLPAEALVVPLGRLRRAEVLGGWWRPRLVLTERDPRTLALVPSEEEGAVSFWIARRDRSLAGALAERVQQGIGAALQSGEEPGEPLLLSDATPADPPPSA